MVHGESGERVAASETWNVIALGFDGPESMTIDGQQRAFGIDHEMALRVARSVPRAVKHDVSYEVAVQYALALEAIGGRYELQPSSQAFMETSAGEHVSPVIAPQRMTSSIPPSFAHAEQPARRSLHAIVPDRMEAPDQIGSEHVLGDHVASGLEIDVVRAQRHVDQGTVDARRKPIEIARAGMSSWPPSASQSLPPPRAVYATLPNKPASSTLSHVWLIAGGVLLFVVGVVGSRTFFVGTTAIAAPVLEGVGALLFARGIWTRLSK